MFFEGVDVDISLLQDAAILEAINTHGRNDIWLSVFNTFYVGHEWFGSGLGTVKDWLLSPKNTTGSFDLLHNDWLHLLCETGLIGIILLILFYINIFKNTFKIYHSSMSKDTQLIALAFACVSVATMVHMFFENSLGGFGYSIPFIYACLYSKSLASERNNSINL